jgi:hypothetical protein
MLLSDKQRFCRSMTLTPFPSRQQITARRYDVALVTHDLVNGSAVFLAVDKCNSLFFTKKKFEITEHNGSSMSIQNPRIRTNAVSV